MYAATHGPCLRGFTVWGPATTRSKTSGVEAVLMWEGLRLHSSNWHLPVLDLTPSTASRVPFIRQEALRGKAEEWETNAQKHSACAREISAIVVVPTRLPTEVTELLICDGHLEFPSLFSADCFTLYSLLLPSMGVSQDSAQGAIHSPLLHQECFPLSSSSSLSLNLTFRPSSLQQGPPLHLQNQEVTNRWRFAKEENTCLRKLGERHLRSRV